MRPFWNWKKKYLTHKLSFQLDLNNQFISFLLKKFNVAAADDDENEDVEDLFVADGKSDINDNNADICNYDLILNIFLGIKEWISWFLIFHSSRAQSHKFTFILVKIF